MRHLFIINPAASKVRGQVDSIREEIESFFTRYPEIHYDIYISKWCRDAMTYIRSYAARLREESRETLRVHAVGGNGILFEAVNGIMGCAEGEIAAYPYGNANVFLRYFGAKNLPLFMLLEHQVFGRSIPVDVIRCGNNYGISYGLTGIEALSDARGDKWIEAGLPTDFSYLISSLPLFLERKNLLQTYHMEIDGKRCDGNYLSAFIANTPSYGCRLHPGADAHPDDGRLEIYLMGNAALRKLPMSMLRYMRGDYRKVKTVTHYSGKHISIRFDSATCMNLDSETFWGTSVEYELLPGALRVACPSIIDLDSLPLLYNKPRSGRRGDAARSTPENGEGEQT